MKRTDDQQDDIVYRNWYHAEFNVFYYEIAGNQELGDRWTVLRDRWRLLFDGKRKVTEELKRELYLEQWRLERDEPEPDFDLLHEAQERTEVVVEQIRQDRTAGAKAK